GSLVSIPLSSPNSCTRPSADRLIRRTSALRSPPLLLHWFLPPLWSDWRAISLPCMYQQRLTGPLALVLAQRPSSRRRRKAHRRVDVKRREPPRSRRRRGR